MKEDKIVIYLTEDGQTQIDVRLENETVWLNVAQMSSLFMKEESNVRRHVLNAFKEGELERDDNNVHFLHVNGVKKPVPFYSLDVIISVGYRVHSKRVHKRDSFCVLNQFTACKYVLQMKSHIVR